MVVKMHEVQQIAEIQENLFKIRISNKLPAINYVVWGSGKSKVFTCTLLTKTTVVYLDKVYLQNKKGVSLRH